ncbi:MAG: radical SAM protein [Candidatus Asgardarchaeia archaeon]
MRDVMMRVSIGTAAVLGLKRLRMRYLPYTAYLMTYHEGRCSANCLFCTQARESRSDMDKLSRVVWPAFPLSEVSSRLKVNGNFKRLCIQCIRMPGLKDYLLTVLEELKDLKIPKSISIHPIEVDFMRELKELGISDIGISIDAANPELFYRIKGKGANGPYSWDRHMKALRDAVEVFGKYHVTTHLIVGLGENDHDLVRLMFEMKDMGVNTALFAFTPMKGTAMENVPRPDINRYRKVQLARYLIYKGLILPRDVLFDGGKISGFRIDEEIIRRIEERKVAFYTSGCKFCNRPFYNEDPSGPLYNIPLVEEEEGSG